MTPKEFRQIMDLIGVAVGKPLAAPSMAVYYKLLGDLDATTLQTGAEWTLINHPWPTFPTVAELRAAATATKRGEVAAMTAAEAWQIAQDIAARHDPEIQGPYSAGGKLWPNQFAYLTRDTPPGVLAAMRAFGVESLSTSGDPDGVIRAQFMKIFDQLAERDRRVAALPAGVRESIEARGNSRPALPAVSAALAGMGRAVE